jgi:uncharacterized protein YbjQ (UPF0145 family)
MITTTTPSIDGRRITTYHGIVVGEAAAYLACLPR